MIGISVFTLIRTDTTLDHSQKARYTLAPMAEHERFLIALPKGFTHAGSSWFVRGRAIELLD